jgi:hypothetical protein
MKRGCHNLIWFALGMCLLIGFCFGVRQALNNPLPHQPPYAQQQTATNPATDHEGDKLAIDRSIARYTLWLAGFTAVLAISTIGLWLTTIVSGRKQSADMSRMADIAEKQKLISGLQTDIQSKQHAIGRLQFLATHRPRLRIRHVNLHEGAEPLGFISWDHGDEVKGSLIVVNAGGTKATIVESRYRIYFSRTGLPAGEAPYDTTFQDLLIPGQELDVGESCVIPLKDKIEMWGDSIPTEDGRTLRRFEQEGWSVYVMGQIRYRDEGGAERFMGFCRKRMSNGRYRPVKSPDYEYED